MCAADVMALPSLLLICTLLFFSCILASQELCFIKNKKESMRPQSSEFSSTNLYSLDKFITRKYFTSQSFYNHSHHKYLLIESSAVRCACVCLCARGYFFIVRAPSASFFSLAFRLSLLYLIFFFFIFCPFE